MFDLFFTNWSDLFRTLIAGILSYAFLVLLLRASGKRTLSKMNAFDLIVTVALGSSLATILLNKNVALADGCLALATLVGLQFLITWSSVRWKWARQLAKSEPSLLYYRDAFVEETMKRTRVTRDEVFAAVRSSHMASMNDVEAVVLETDGSFSVIRRTNDHDEHSSLPPDAGIG